VYIYRYLYSHRPWCEQAFILYRCEQLN